MVTNQCVFARFQVAQDFKMKLVGMTSKKKLYHINFKQAIYIKKLLV